MSIAVQPLFGGPVSAPPTSSSGPSSVASFVSVVSADVDAVVAVDDGDVLALGSLSESESDSDAESDSASESVPEADAVELFVSPNSTQMPSMQLRPGSQPPPDVHGHVRLPTVQSPSAAVSPHACDNASPSTAPENPSEDLRTISRW
jgi:hypothetical protein